MLIPPNEHVLLLAETAVRHLALATTPSCSRVLSRHFVFQQKVRFLHS